MLAIFGNLGLPALRGLGIVSLILGMVSAAHATILFNSAGGNNFGQDPILADGPQYASFMTDATGHVDTVALELDSGILPNGAGIVGVNLFDNGINGSSNYPNNFVQEVGSVRDLLLTSTPSVVSFTHLGIILNPDTRYWVGLSDITPNGFVSSSIEWSFTTDVSGLGVADEWINEGITGSQADSSGIVYMMHVGRGQPVPEPASVGLFCLGLACVGLLRGRRASG
jgi:hypothetical protein